MKKIIGVDIGGTEIKGALFEGDKILKQYKIPTMATLGIDQIKKNIYEVVDNLFVGDIYGIGIATAGTVDTINGSIIFATDNLPGYTGYEIKKDITNRYNVVCEVENDANSALLGEMKYGSAKNYNNAVMITLGTGVGGAIAIDGKIFHGKNYNAGRLGHTILYPNGIKCNCGQTGCAECYLSGTALTNMAKDIGINIKHGSEIFTKHFDNPKIKEVLNIYFTNLKALLLSIKNSLSPDIIIIGGGVVNSANYWWSEYIEPMTDNNFNIKLAKLDNTAGIFGAKELIK